jgi:hypothetical protein
MLVLSFSLRNVEVAVGVTLVMLRQREASKPVTGQKDYIMPSSWFAWGVGEIGHILLNNLW